MDREVSKQSRGQFLVSSGKITTVKSLNIILGKESFHYQDHGKIKYTTILRNIHYITVYVNEKRPHIKVVCVCVCVCMLFVFVIKIYIYINYHIISTLAKCISKSKPAFLCPHKTLSMTQTSSIPKSRYFLIIYYK